ncbi:hypothetical protein HPB49_003112 [Dermacentor silvarum]|uniref:Uncharacterized protein n=1 Tax=Dermacentor silvarum TaxID=543639 RepID=A0ACB8DU45_DERSI|nr:hypothetical protein HPB49_003112 [Dermacentor silvarum]
MPTITPTATRVGQYKLRLKKNIHGDHPGKMASASSQLNAVSHDRFTALATEDMDFFAVRGNDLHPSDIVGWKTSGKQVSQQLNKPQLNEVTKSSKPTSQFSEAQAKRMIARITKASRMLLNLPREEQNIVIRPRGGLCLARLEADIVMTAVITAANVLKTAAKADTIRTNPTQNIIVISTPDEERARYYASVRSLYIEGRNYKTHAYCTAPHGTVKGVIHHVARCKPHCKLCNGAQATGAEGCTNKYKVPFVVTERRWERRNAGSTFSSQDFPQLPPQQQQQQNEAHLLKKRCSRSRKRDKSRARSASRGSSTDGKRSENMHVAQVKDNTVQSLRNENDQLKRCITEQRAQMQEMNAKPPTPTENNTNSAMEVQAPVTTEANSAEPETIDVANTSEPAPKKRALEHARQRRVNARLDRLEERQDRLEQTMKANYETLSQAIKATNDRLDATNARLDTSFAKPPSTRTVRKGVGQGVCTLVKKNLTSIDHELLPNGAIEHTTVEIVTGKRKRRESTFIINVYSNPKHFQQKLRTLVHKAQQLAGPNVTLLCGDFNAQHTAWGYPYTTAKGHSLYDETMDAGYQLLNDPNAPTRNGTSSQRDTNPDLAFISTASALRGVSWRNTGETLGSDHCILEITIPIAESTQRAQQQQIVDWHEYRKKLEDNVTETIENIEAWTNMLNATTKDATQTVEAEPEATMLDSRLAHLMEARNSLRRHWKRQRHNRKLRKRIAQLNRDIEHHSAVLCREQWHAVCQEADGQLHKGKTWRLLRHLLNDQTTKEAQHYMLNKTIHKAVNGMGEAEVQRRLDAKYLLVTPTDPLPSYEGATNE